MMWRGLLTEEEVVESMVDGWKRGYGILTTPTACFLLRRWTEEELDEDADETYLRS